MKNEIVLYQQNTHAQHIEVRVEKETVWLNRNQIAALFNRDVKTIGKHINNVLKEELKDFPVVAKFATTAIDGKTYQVEYYNLDMIISIGYRVKSSQGIQFRIWANKILKDYLLKGYSLHTRMNKIEDNVHSLIKEFQRLKDIEIKFLDWDIKRSLTKLNYRIHTDAIKQNLIPKSLNKQQIAMVNATETDVLNMALYGKTAKQWIMKK